MPQHQCCGLEVYLIHSKVWTFPEVQAGSPRIAAIQVEHKSKSVMP